MQEKKKKFFFKAICCLQYFITVALGKEYSSEQIQWIIRPERRLRSYNMVDEDVKCRIWIGRDSRIPIFREMSYFLVLKARKEGNETKRKQGKERYNETSNKFK